jgi:hypothetical protein
MMMKSILTSVAVTVSLFAGVLGLAVPTSVMAQSNEVITGELCRGPNVLDPTACNVSTAQSALGRILSVIVQTLVFIVGGISMIMIVIGGLRYVTSAGDPNTTKGAKDTVLYAVIGIVVAVLAQGLVTFVLSRV